MEPPSSSSIFRKSSNIRKPIRCVNFTNALVRLADIRDQNPSLGMFCPVEPHQRNPNAPNLEDRYEEETEWQEPRAREASWRLANSVLKLKEHERATFFSPSENRCLPASTLKPEEREFVVHPGASMHMISKKDLSKAEMDSLKKSCSPTIVITANGEVQTHVEAIVYVKELDIFMTMKSSITRQQYYRLETIAMKTEILMSGSTVKKNHILIKNGIRIICNTENFVRIVIPGSSASSSSSSHYSTSMTLSKQEIDHPTSPSPIMTMSSDRDWSTGTSEWDSHPALVSSSHVERIERGDPLFSDTPE